eukprot:7272334-Pyramimonas_sp.AAC.1
MSRLKFQGALIFCGLEGAGVGVGVPGLCAMRHVAADEARVLSRPITRVVNSPSVFITAALLFIIPSVRLSLA